MAEKEVKVIVSGDASGAKSALQEAREAARLAAAEAQKVAAETKKATAETNAQAATVKAKAAEAVAAAKQEEAALKSQKAASDAATAAFKAKAAEAVAATKQEEAAIRSKIAAHKAEQLEIKKSTEAAKQAAKDSVQSSSEAMQAAQQSTAGIGKLGAAFESIKGLAAIGFISEVGRSIVSTGSSAVMAAAQMKQYEVAFSTMLKSMEAGKAMLQDLKDFATRTPFDVPGVVESAQQLVAFGFDAKSIIPTLTVLGDAAAGLGKGSEGVKLMAYALGQIRTSGNLKTQDMMQLTSAGVAAWDMLAAASGKSVAEIKDMTEKGMIDSLAAIDVITEGMQDEYGGMMDQLSREVKGLTSNISESVGNLIADIGEYMTSSFAVKEILQGVSDSIGKMSEAFRAAKDAGKSFGEAIVEALPAPLLIAIGAVVALIAGALVGALLAAKAAIIAVAAPVVLLAAKFALVGAAIAALLSVSETVRDALSMAFEAVKTVISTVIQIVQDLSNIFDSSSKSMGEKMAEAIGYIGGLFYRLYGNITEAMDKAFDAVIDFVKDSVNSFVNFIKEVSNMGDNFVDIMKNAGKLAVEGIEDWFNKLGPKLSKIINSVQAGFTLSAEGDSLGIKGWMSSGNSDDYDRMSEDFDIYTGTKAKRKPVDLTGSGSKSKQEKPSNSGLDKTEREINRIAEALAAAKDKTLELQSKFDDMSLKINLDGMYGGEKVFAQIDYEKNQKLKAIDETLKAEKNAANEAAKMRESAMKTGDAKIIADAQALYDERNSLYEKSLIAASGMRTAVEQQAADKALQIETQLQAAKLEAERAMNAIKAEEFLAYLESEAAIKYAYWSEEQAYRQQMFDWEMESQQTLLSFAMQAAETMKNQLASGIAAVITEGQSFGKMLANIGKQILNMFLQWIIGRALASAMQKMFAKKDSATLAAQAAKDTLALTPPAILNESLHPGSIGKAAITVGIVAGVGMAASSFGGDIGDNRTISDKMFGGIGGDYGLSNSMLGGMGGGKSFANGGFFGESSYIKPETVLRGGGGGIGAVSAVQNIYGDINNGSDAESLWDDFNYNLAGAVRSG